MAYRRKPKHLLKKRGRKQKNVRVNNDTFTKVTSGGRRSHDEVAKTLMRLERRKAAWTLLKAGATFQQIADELTRRGTFGNVSVYTAFTDCKQVMGEENEKLALDAEEWRRLHIERTEHIILTNRNRMDRKEAGGAAVAKHSEVILAALDRQAKMIGIDKARPQTGYTYEQVQGLLTTLRDGMLAAFTEPEDRQRLLGVLRTLGHRAPAIEARTEET